MSNDNSFDFLASFLNYAEKCPMKLAVVESNRQINYGEFACLARRIANHCKQRATQPKVVVLFSQSIEAYASMFGTLLAGGYYCPINTSSPLNRQKMIIDKFAPDLIIGEAEFLGEYSKNYFTIDPSQINEDALNEPEPSNELAYVIFTSGSTGVPKGVMITTEALTHYIKTMVSEMGIRSDDRLSQHPNVGFDLSVLDVYGCLCSGATLYPVQNSLDRMNLSKFIARYKLTIWNSVPSVVDVMFRSKSISCENFRSIRLFTFCGEPLLKRHLDVIFDICPRVKVHNTYGPTEATVSCTLLRLSKTSYLSACDKHSVALGDPISEMNIYLDGDGNSSQEGEIVITGPQLARGYWKDNVKSASSFKEFEVNGVMTRSYFTGDYAYRKGDQVFFNARKDDQIKINGFRLELGEVDEAVRIAAGLICKSIFYNNKIFTFVQSGKNFNVEELKSRIKQDLPNYAMPESIILLEKLPTNANDKIDTQQLRELIRTKP